MAAAGPHLSERQGHPNPDAAKCDGAQSLTFENFADLMNSVNAIRATMNGG